MQVYSLLPKYLATTRDAPNMLKNLSIISSRTSQNLSLFKMPLTYYSQIIPLSKKIIAIAS